MRNIAACYSEHAIKVSDSYCSGPSNQPYISSNTKNPTIQNAVICIYKLNLSTKSHLFIKFTWSTNQFFTITIIDDPKINWQIRMIKGSKRLEFLNLKIELIWDLSNAKYESGPEPINGFYIAILINSELNLLLGTIEEDEEEELKLKKLFSAKRFSLISRTVNFSGDAMYSAMARFSDGGKNHEILIKCSAEERGMKNWVLGVWIDKKSAIEVKRLKWNFRGNQTIFVDGLLVDMMWDVYDWFFNPKSGGAVFMFRPRSGLDSRLWMEEKINLEHNHRNKEQEKIGFSCLICVCKCPPSFLID
ncbi:hypothetical protein LguiA_016003 [Lonicera macranthoides]